MYITGYKLRLNERKCKLYVSIYYKISAISLVKTERYGVDKVLINAVAIRM